MLEKLNKASFDPHLNTTFEVQTENMGIVDVELVEITEKSDDFAERFSLIFRGDKTRILHQAIHKMKHADMGDLDLFIVPIVHDKQDGIYYQAVFNRLKEKKGD